MSTPSITPKGRAVIKLPLITFKAEPCMGELANPIDKRASSSALRLLTQATKVAKRAWSTIKRPWCSCQSKPWAARACCAW